MERLTSNTSRQEMAKWKCYLSRVLFSDKGFTEEKFVHPFLTKPLLYVLTQLKHYKNSQAYVWCFMWIGPFTIREILRCSIFSKDFALLVKQTPHCLNLPFFNNSEGLAFSFWKSKAVPIKKHHLSNQTKSLGDNFNSFFCGSEYRFF